MNNFVSTQYSTGKLIFYLFCIFEKIKTKKTLYDLANERRLRWFFTLIVKIKRTATTTLSVFYFFVGWKNCVENSLSIRFLFSSLFLIFLCFRFWIRFSFQYWGIFFLNGKTGLKSFNSPVTTHNTFNLKSLFCKIFCFSCSGDIFLEICDII